MLLQIFYSVRSERQLMEQTQYNLLFRWFIGLAMDDTVWVASVFSKNRERLLEHDAVIELFNQILEIADKKDLLSGEHFSVDGTLIQAWASQKSFRPKASAEDAQTPNGDNPSQAPVPASVDFKGERRSNETHQSTTEPEARSYRKGNTAAKLSFMAHGLMDNRHGLVASGCTTQADGYAEREAAKAMLADVRQVTPDEDVEITIGADKGYDAAEFIAACERIKVTPHVAQNNTNRRSAVADSIASSAEYAISIQKRKLIEQVFGWGKTVGQLARLMVRGMKRVDQMVMLTFAAYNLTRMRTLGQVRLKTA
jgi:IS5 family transposase